MNMNKILWAIIEEDSNITFANLCSGDSVYKSPSEPESSRSGVLTPAGRTPRQMKVQGPHVLTRPSCGWGGGRGHTVSYLSCSKVLPLQKQEGALSFQLQGARGGRTCKALQSSEIFVTSSRRKMKRGRSFTIRLIRPELHQQR